MINILSLSEKNIKRRRATYYYYYYYHYYFIIIISNSNIIIIIIIIIPPLQPPSFYRSAGSITLMYLINVIFVLFSTLLRNISAIMIKKKMIMITIYKIKDDYNDNDTFLFLFFVLLFLSVFLSFFLSFS